MDPYRVFVSYSSDDQEIARGVVEQLDKIGMKPVWDQDFLPGPPFSEQILDGISFAHVFMPVLTDSSKNRPWVHQEIGFALGHNVPVLPVAIGQLPEGMIRQLHVLRLHPDLRNLSEKLRPETVERVVSWRKYEHLSTFECAGQPFDRAQMLARYARKILQLGKHGRVRQAGLLTSFSVPDKPVDDPIWTERLDGKTPDPRYCEQLREERRALQEHAEEAGCDLIISPGVPYKDNGDRGKAARLRELLEFLEQMPDDKVRVAVHNQDSPANLLIVGDWFVAESITPHSVAYLQTVATRHAPTVLEQLRRFDRKFQLVLQRAEGDPRPSRPRAMEVIRRELDGLAS